jgi:signal transduction histidine kinase
LVAFTVLRWGLRELCARAGLSLDLNRRTEHAGLLMPLALSPLAVLPLMAGAWLGDGSMLLMLATVLSMLVLVREAGNLASARAEAEAERDRLARANQFQDEMMHLITHELKNPLTSVRVYTQLGQRALKTRAIDTIADCFGGIAHAERALERLIDNLLQIGMLEQSGALPPSSAIDLAEMAEDVVGDLRAASMNKQQELTLDVSGDLPIVSAPPVLLRQALSNLVSNAIKYTPEGGRVLVAVCWTETRDAVLLTVADTGFGLSEEDLARLFTKFFRSSDSRVLRERGTGLGLALTHAIVNRMGGQLSVTSRLNQGSTFQILLPVAARPTTNNAAPQASGYASPAAAL